MSTSASRLCDLPHRTTDCAAERCLGAAAALLLLPPNRSTRSAHRPPPVLTLPQQLTHLPDHAPAMLRSICRGRRRRRHAAGWPRGNARSHSRRTGSAVDATDLDRRISLETHGESPPACCEVGATAIKSTACRSRFAAKATATTTHAAERRQLTELGEETSVDLNRYRCPSRTIRQRGRSAEK
jgi:hypothetical protein